MKYLVLLFSFALALAPQAVRAGELDLTGDLSGFTSPGNVYGPWQTLTGTYRWVAGPDTPGVTLVTRAIAINSPRRTATVWCSTITTPGRRAFSPMPRGASRPETCCRTAASTSKAMRKSGSTTTVLGGGIGVVVNPDGPVQRYINVGPTFYANNFNITLRYLQTFTTGRTAAGTALMTVQSGQTGKTVSTLTLLAGDQPPNGIAEASQIAVFGQRTVLAGFSVKHWTDPRAAFSRASISNASTIASAATCSTCGAA